MKLFFVDFLADMLNTSSENYRYPAFVTAIDID